MIFIERLIFRTLKAGLDEMIAYPEKFEAFILEGLTPEEPTAAELTQAEDEAARARTEFEAQPPNIIHGYARRDGVFPCWAIVLGGESTDTDFIGEDAMDSYLEDPEDDDTRQVYRDADGNREDPHIRRWGHNFEVYCYADHPDSTLYYYYLAKQLLAESRSAFQVEDLDEITYTGADLAPDPRYLPSGMFVRRLGMKMASDQVYVERLKPGVDRAAQLAGIHVAEDQDDATGVDANITASTTE